jgi:uncharacterized membrane protein
MITSSIEIERPQPEVFAYIDDVQRQPEWQTSLVSSRKLSDGPTGVGTRFVQARKAPGGSQELTNEITEYDPPNRSSWQGLDGPIRSAGTVSVESLGESRSRVTVEFDLAGHGIGKLFVPFVRAQARKQVPSDQQKLKQLLESGAPPG